MVKKVHVISHTHWDFEWYFTVNESSVQFVYHMDEVFRALEEGKLRYYLLDGQMSIVDDYLRFCPENKERLEALVQAGKLFIGPWYTQTDELVISGESIVRNLQIGLERAAQLGGAMKIGYLPDSFGQGKDMPKIYRGMGIHDAVFWRGVPNEKVQSRDFIWTSEDGSDVTVANIKDGYFVGVGLIEKEEPETLVTQISKGAGTDQLLLPVGGDQRFVDFNLKDRIASYNEKLTDTELSESHYEAYFKAIHRKDLPKVSGEFISSSVSKIHRSIYSSRYDQKYMNDKLERRLIYQLEPLMVMAESLGIPYKKELLEEIWKLVLRNHAHDSAGGCNSDATNQIINERFKEADELSYSAVDYLTRKIAESRKTTQPNDLVFYNTLPYPIRKIARFEVSVTTPSIRLWQEGEEWACQILNTEKRYRGEIKRDESLYDPEKYYYVHTVSAEIEIPGLSFVTCQVEEVAEQAEFGRTTRHAIENERYRFTLQNGKAMLVDKASGAEYADFLWLEDGGDEGDTYDYSPAYHDDIYRLDFADAEVSSQTGELESCLFVSGTFAVARDLEDRKAGKRSAEIPYRMEVRLAKDTERIEFNLKMDNRAQDHRMRLIVQTDIQAKHSYTDTPFGTINRPVIDPHLHDWKKLNWREEPTAIFPMLHYLNLHNLKSSWTFLAKGMKEYQIVGEKFDQMAVTLFRSVGYLGRPDLIRRPGDASGNQYRYVETPDSQLEKELHFKFALVLDKTYNPAQIMRDYQHYAVSQPYYQIQNLNAFTTALKYFVSNPLPEKVEKPLEWQLSPRKLVFSSFSKTGKDGIAIRFFNPNMTEEVPEEKIHLPRKMKVAFTNLNGEALTEKIFTKDVLLGHFKPGEIKTIVVYPN